MVLYQLHFNEGIEASIEASGFLGHLRCLMVCLAVRAMGCRAVVRRSAVSRVTLQTGLSSATEKDRCYLQALPLDEFARFADQRMRTADAQQLLPARDQSLTVGSP